MNTPWKMLGWSILLAAGVMGHAQAASWNLACPKEVKELPRLQANDATVLEPSGVIWDPASKMAVGVSDEMSAYALFAFDPYRVVTDSSGKTMRAWPLLNPDLVKKLKPADLEGITRQAHGPLVATASLGLKNGKPRDTVLRFSLVKGPSAAQSVQSLQQVAPAGDGFRNWLIQSAKPPWDKKINTLEGEGGINVEGLAASGRDDRLFLGFREPVVDGRIPVFSFRIDSQGRPVVGQWHALKLGKGFEEGGILGLGKEAVGIRDMTPVGGTNQFLLLLGASGSGSEIPFQVGWWRDDQDEIAYVGKVPKGFRAEGLTLVSGAGEPLELLLVSDKGGMVMTCQASPK